MIVNRPLTETEQARSRLCYTIANGFGSIGGTLCIGIMLLAGAELGLSSKVLSTFGAVNYASYMAIPLGILVTRRFGAGASMLWGKVVITLTCLGLAGSGYLSPFWGAFVFLASMGVLYLSNSASIALLWPVQRCITDSSILPGFLSLNNIVIQLMSVTTSLLISWYLSKFGGYGAFAFLFLVSGFFYILNGVFFGLMTEPEELRAQSSRPIMPQVLSAWREPGMKKQLAANFVCNAVSTMVLPVGVLSATRGFHASNSMVMLLTLCQTVMMICASTLFPRIVRWMGICNSLIWSIVLLISFCVSWLFIPDNAGFAGLLAPFVLFGFISSFWGLALNTYFVGTVKPEDQLGGVMLVFIGTGMIPALAAIALNPLVFALLEMIPADSSADLYRRFFLLSLLFCPLLFYVFKRLSKVV